MDEELITSILFAFNIVIYPYLFVRGIGLIIKFISIRRLEKKLNNFWE